MASSSAWRVSDVVEYDLLRDAAVALAAALLSSSDGELSSTRELKEELIALRSKVATVDGYDRGAVSALRHRIDARVLTLCDV